MSKANRRMIRRCIAMVAVAMGATGSASAEHVAQLYRDQYGLPHVYAAREEDGFYGVGYATGQDRLKQVLTWYLAVRGELAASFGTQTPPAGVPSNTSAAPSQTGFFSDAVVNDTITRRYRLLEVARRTFAQLPRQLQKDLQAYVDGLAAYMREHPDETPAWAPRLEPALPLATLDRLVMEQRGICDSRYQSERASASTATPATSAQGRALAASNAWVVGGSRTDDGGVTFESDSHGPVELYGSAFYPFRIKAGTLDFYAVTVVGSPTFLFGHSPDYAWGYTEGPRNLVDCYRVQVDPKNPRVYRYDGVAKRMVTREYRIAVRGQKPVRGTFEYTRHNGILSPVEVRDGNTAYVSSYASAERIGQSTLEYYNMAHAHNRHELEAALAQEDAYPANLLIGGADGTFMYIRPGRIPVRPPGVDARHTLDGNTSSTAWKGFHSYAQALKLINPAQGYVGNTNVSPDMMFPESPLKPADYPAYFGFVPGDTNSRQVRLIELLEHASGLAFAGAQAIAMDETPPGARSWAAPFQQMLAAAGGSIARQPPEIREFVAELARFDGAFSKDSRAALYHAELRRALFDHHPAEMNSGLASMAAGAALSDSEQQLLIQAVQEARARLTTNFGRTDLTWGDVHRIGRGSVDFPVGAGNILVGDVQRAARASGSAAAGQEWSPVGAATLRALQFKTDPATHRERFIGGQRVPFIVHFSPHGVESYGQMLWGVSDDPSSAHYSDQAGLASNKTLRRIPLTVAALMDEGATVTTLKVADSKAQQ